MERGQIVFGLLFLALPVLLLLGIMVAPAYGFALMLTLVALLTLGFSTAVAFIDVD